MFALTLAAISSCLTIRSIRFNSLTGSLVSSSWLAGICFWLQRFFLQSLLCLVVQCFYVAPSFGVPAIAFVVAFDLFAELLSTLDLIFFGFVVRFLDYCCRFEVCVAMFVFRFLYGVQSFFV